MATLYDIWLSHGCNPEPDLSDFPTIASLLRDSAFRARLLMRKPGPGGAWDWGGKPAEYLGLDLPLDIAWKLGERLKQCHGNGEIVPVAYRIPRISKEEALLKAQREVARWNEEQKNLPDEKRVTFSVPTEEYMRWSPMAWGFFAGVPKWIEEGYIPGGRFIHIDKLDGHLWEPAERACYHWYLHDQLRGGPRPGVVPREPYDVYLTMGCRSLPHIEAGSSGERFLTDPSLQERLLTPFPGLLGISATLGEAADVLRRCTAVEDRTYLDVMSKGLSMLVPVAYREPTISREEAIQISKEHARRLHPEESWNGKRAVNERQLYWQIRLTASPSEGAATDRPRAIGVNVDKLDGHIWEVDEEEEYDCRYHDLGYVHRATW